MLQTLKHEFLYFGGPLPHYNQFLLEFFCQTRVFHLIKMVKTMDQKNNSQKLMKAFGSWKVFYPQSPGVREATSVITGHVQCKYHQPHCRQCPPQGSEIRSHYHGLEPGEARNAQGSQAQAMDPSSPPRTQASSTESPTPLKTSFQLAPERRLRAICPDSSGI